MTTPMKPNAARMQLAVDFVTAHASTGVTMRSTILHVLASFDEDKRERPTAYKQASSVVERIIKDRHVRVVFPETSASLAASPRPVHGDARCYPWDEKRKAYAEALERAANLAPTTRERLYVRAMVYEAWRAAGDEARARTLENLHARLTENDGHA